MSTLTATTLHEHVQAEARQRASDDRAEAARFVQALVRVATTGDGQAPSADDLRTLFGPLPEPLRALRFDAPTGERLTAQQVEQLLGRYRDHRAAVAALADVEQRIERRGGSVQAIQDKIDALTPSIEAEIRKLREPLIRLEGARRMLELLESQTAAAKARVVETRGLLSVRIGTILDLTSHEQGI